MWIPLLVAATLASGPAPQRFELSAPLSLIAPVSIDGIRIADLDLDGYLDLVAARSRGVTTWFGDGNSGFERVDHEIPGGFQVGDVAVLDFDGDLVPDIAATDRDENKVFLLNGLGNRGFIPTELFFPALRPLAVRATDLDGDGNSDLVVGRAQPARIVLLYGDGVGNVDEVFQLGVAQDPEDLRVADLDGDGELDIVTVGPVTGEVSVLLGNGTRRPDDAMTFPFGSRPAAVDTGDLNGDGHLDLVVLDTATDSVLVALGVGDGTFGAPNTTPIPGPSPIDLELADGNEDQELDVLVGLSEHGAANGLLLLPGDGTGGLLPGSFFNVGNRPKHLALDDLDGDGHLDVALSNGSPARVHVTFGRGDGTFPGPSEVPFELGADFALIDIDADGILDLVHTSSPPSELHVSLGDGQGGFLLSETSGIVGYGSPLLFGDVNEDGLLDILIPSSLATSTRLNILTTSLDDGFDLSVRSEDQFPFRPLGGAAVHVFGPNFIDLVVVDAETDEIKVLRNDGVGGFDLVLTRATLVSDILDFHAGEFNGDTIPDLLLVTAQEVQLVYGAVAGGFVDGPVVPVSEGCRVCSLSEDLDGDGLGDLLLSGDDAISVYLRRDPEGFILHQEIPSSGPASLFLSDLNGDGHRDLVHRARSSVLIHAGDGTGTFSSPTSFWMDREPSQYRAADVDGDGVPDLVHTQLARLRVTRNASLDALRSRRGNVNAAVGPVTDVLFLNGSAGAGDERCFTLDVDEPFSIRLELPPSLGSQARYAVYAVLDEPRQATHEILPFSVGSFSFSIPLTGGSPPFVLNTLGFEALLGTPTRPSSPAPTRLVHVPSGLGFGATLSLQGLIRDLGSLQGTIAVTNALVVTVE